MWDTDQDPLYSVSYSMYPLEDLVQHALANPFSTRLH